MFDQANGSSIFLDEIGDLTFPVQTKLLRVLQNKEIRPLGSNRRTPAFWQPPTRISSRK